MRKLVVASLLLLAACQPPITHPVPRQGRAETHAQVIVVANEMSAFRFPIMLDGFVVEHLRSGRHLVMWLTPGVHSIGGVNQTVSLDFRAGQVYTFEAREIAWFRRIEVDKAMPLVKNTAPM